MNRDRATAALMALAYSAYDRLLGLAPIDWEAQARGCADTVASHSAISRSTFRSQSSWAATSIPRTGRSRCGRKGDKLAMQFRTLRFTLVYQGHRQFLSVEPIAEGAPQISVRFSKPKPGEPPTALRLAQLRCGRSGGGVYACEVDEDHVRDAMTTGQ